MNILHVRASDFYGGPERQLHYHARAVRGTDLAVTVGSFLEHGRQPEFLDRIADDEIPTHAFPVKSAYDLASVGLLRRYLRETHVDVLCTHDYRSSTLGWLARRGTAARWVAFSRGFTLTRAKIRFFQGIERMVIRSADHLVAVSQAQKDKLVPLGIDPSRITVARNAVDLAALSRVDAVDLRSRFDFPADAVILVTGGRFSKEKGQDDLVTAALAALDSRPHLRFVLFGAGPDLDAIQARVTAAGESERILCPGFEKNLLGCLQGADVLVNPSWSEGLPNIVLEAMALAIPVVATAVGGVPEILTDGETGWLVPAQDPPTLARALLHAADHADERRRRADAARQFAESQCSFERQAEVLAEVYRRVQPERAT